MTKIDYGRMRYLQQTHHARYVRRVGIMQRKLFCPMCGGSGGEIEPVLDDGGGPCEHCGWCEGTGLVTPWLWGRGMHWRRLEKRGRALLRANGEDA